MPPEPDRVDLSLEDRQAYAEVHRDYEVKLYSDGRLIFTCARCRLVFDRDDFAPMAALIDALNAHKASHGPPSAQARALPGKRAARRRALDDAGRPDQSRFAFDHGEE